MSALTCGVTYGNNLYIITKKLFYQDLFCLFEFNPVFKQLLREGKKSQKLKMNGAKLTQKFTDQV